MRIAIDPGTSFIRIHAGDELRLEEPSVVAIDYASRRVLAVGEAARQMAGRTPPHVGVLRPMRDGVIADPDLMGVMLKQMMEHGIGWRRALGARVMVTAPLRSSTVERQAVLDAAAAAGARGALLVDAPTAAAVGAGVDVETPQGTLVVHVGGGSTEVAVISLGRVVVSESAVGAGEQMDEAILRWIRASHNLAIPPAAAEAVKIRLGSALPLARLEGPDALEAEVLGRDVISNQASAVLLTARGIREALEEPLERIAETVRSVLERVPPELASDIADGGAILTGGGALLRGLDRYLSDLTGLAVRVADAPALCAVEGAGRRLAQAARLRAA